MSSESYGSGEKPNGFSEVKASETAPRDGIPNPGDSEAHRRRNSMDALLAKQVFPPQMTTKVKGLLKGLRYISQIFEPGKEQEQEMQIGHPTDVKHVAHIGWDGPSGPSTTTTTPTWVNENKPTTQGSLTKPLSTPKEIKEQQGSPTKKTSHGSRNSNGDPEHPKSSRRHQTQDSATDNVQSDAPKALRRHQSSSSSASTGEASDLPRQPRRRSQKPSSGLDSSTKESSSIDAPNHARRKKSNRPTDGGSTRPSRSRVQAAANSDSEAKNTEEQPPPSKPKEEEEIQSV